VYISRDVVFDENVFPFASLHPNAGALLKKEILLLPSSTSHESAQNCTTHIVPIVSGANVLQETTHADENNSQNSAEIGSKTADEHQSQHDETSTEHEVDFPRHSSDSIDPEVQQSEEDSPRQPSVASAGEQASPVSLARGGHTPGGPQAPAPLLHRRVAPLPLRTSPRPHRCMRINHQDHMQRTRLSSCLPLDPLWPALVRAQLLGEKVLQTLKILKIILMTVLQLLHHLHLHRLEFVLGYREVYIIQDNIPMVQSIMACCLLHVNHLHSQKL
jgi:hypothetical protein